MPVTHAADPAAPTDTTPHATTAPAPAFLRRHRVPLIATLTVLPLYAVWATLLATGGGDLAAQVAWAEFVARYGTSAYNLFWYGGMHTASYSVISPYAMAAFGVRTVSVVSGLTASWAAAALVVRTGVRGAVAPALLVSFTLWCNVASGRTTFALGVAFGLVACVLLTGQRWAAPASVCAVLATLASPVAGLFLAVVGAAFLVVRDGVRAAVLLVPPAVVVTVTTVLFPFSGEQLMPAERIWVPALLGLVVAALAPRPWRVARWSGAVYATGTVLVYLVPSPIGTNVERFAALFAPATLCAVLTAGRGRGRGPTVPARLRRLRRATLLVALLFSLTWVGFKTVTDLRVTTPVPAWAAHTRGVTRALRGLGADRARVEVVPARSHREAAELAPHVHLARGWNRQLDMERARLFYDGTFSAAAYRAWLDHWAVGFVVLPLAEPDAYAEAEARLVREDRPDWLEPVWQDAHWRIYRVRGAVPLVSAPATVVRTTSAAVDLRLPRPGRVTVRVAYSPWLHADGGCLTRDGDFTRLTAARSGEYRISSEYGPSPASDHC
ncbi:hypothetical protein [Streptomyces sp. NPDC046862]|uniref:hypothetical protein n=1 Tax=Streptomyces sp. NPDC046862 TaxID=3154603 RepID=UPI0034512004